MLANRVRMRLLDTAHTEVTLTVVMVGESYWRSLFDSNNVELFSSPNREGAMTYDINVGEVYTLRFDKGGFSIPVLVALELNGTEIVRYETPPTTYPEYFEMVSSNFELYEGLLEITFRILEEVDGLFFEPIFEA